MISVRTVNCLTVKVEVGEVLIPETGRVPTPYYSDTCIATIHTAMNHILKEEVVTVTGPGITREIHRCERHPWSQTGGHSAQGIV